MAACWKTPNVQIEVSWRSAYTPRCYKTLMKISVGCQLAQLYDGRSFK